MALELDLSKSPYYDDYDVTDNFYRVLHRPGHALQSRELTTTQSVLQNQIEKFGRHIFKDGSIVERCELVYEKNLPYVKVVDTYANGFSLTISDLKGKYLQSDTTGLRAYVSDTIAGALTSAPDLNTAYVNYVNSGDNYTTKEFSADETLTVYTSSNVSAGQVTTANDSVSGNSSYKGFGYRVGVSTGTVFQKGFFIRVSPQTLIVSKYHNEPDKISVGFHTVESIVTPEEDSSLLDNAAGSENYAAPGAHRLKLTPTLVYRDTSNTSNSNTEVFFSLVDFIEGNPARAFGEDPAYAALGDEIAKRTNEESGDYVIEPFNLRCLPISSNTTHTKLEIDPGLAYIKGYRVKTVGKLVGSIRKSDDIRQAEGQVVSVTLGNYTYVNELGGLFDFPTMASVSLRDSTAEVITTATALGSAVDSVSAPGNEIGTAKLVGLYHETGEVGLANTQYRMYLTDVVMGSNQAFANVRSIYTITGSSKGFADLVLTNNNAHLRDTNLTPLVYDLGTRYTKSLLTSSNTINAQFDFRTAANVTFSTAGAASLSVSSYVGGTNKLPYGIGLLDSTSEQDFVVVTTSNAVSTNNAGKVTNSAANVVEFEIGQANDFSIMYVVGDHVAFLNSTASETRQITNVSTTQLHLADALTYSWANNDHARVYPAGLPVPFSSNSARTITVTSNTDVSFDMGENFSGTFDTRIYYNVRRTNASPAGKKLYSGSFVKIDTATHGANSVGPWSLGIPDCFILKHVYVGNTYSNTNPDFGAMFTLDSGQGDTRFGLSKLTRRPGYTVDANSKFLVEVMSFAPDISQGIGYYSVDSFDIDDAGNGSANTLYTKYLPGYVSTLANKGFAFRDSVDFRGYATATANYASNASVASINPDGNNVMGSTAGAYLPVVGSTFESDVQYYLARKDVVGLTPQGTLVVTEGNPAERPIEPHRIPNGISLSYVEIPPYPSLTAQEKSGLPGAKTITFKPIKNRRYTMRDIGLLDDRISRVEYYTSLNMLEQSTKNLLLESTTGGDRFKNGILADPFNGHDIGNVLDPDYNVAMDPKKSEARPIVSQQLVQLKFDSGAGIGVSNNGKLVLLAHSEVGNTYLSQPYATQLRNPNQDIAFRWLGHVNLSPEGDYTPDVTVNPEVSIDIDLYSNFKFLYDQINGANTGQGAWTTQWGTWEETDRREEVTQTTEDDGSFIVTVTQTDFSGPGGVGWGYPDPVTGEHVWVSQEMHDRLSELPSHGPGTFYYLRITNSSTTLTTTTEVDEARAGVQTNIQESISEYDLGSYVTDVALQPFIRAQAIYFQAVGLKPSTKMWGFFDDNSITQYCAQVTDSGLGDLGGPLITDATGTIEGWFFLPASTFRSGDRKFRLLDIEDLVTESTILRSSCEATFHGTNLWYAKNNIGINIKDAEIQQRDVEETRTVVSAVSTVTPNRLEEIYDPAAQSWVMPEERIDSSRPLSGVYISSIGVYFERKHPTLGITFMIRETENGYPSPRVVPYGVKHLTSAEIQVSEDATLETKVTFPAPLHLEGGKEYCVVALPDGFNPECAMWTAALGGDPDVTLNVPIYGNAFIGNFFTSSSDTGWTSYQQEDLKINIYRVSFSTLDATATFVNEDWEYITMDSQLGTFRVGETLYFSNNVDYSNGVAVESGNTVVGLAANTGFSANDKVYILSNTNVSAFIANVTAVGTNTVTLNVIPGWTDSDSEIGHLRNNGLLTGKLYQWAPLVGKAVVSNSSATNIHYVTANTRVIGETSNASGNVASVDVVYYNTVMPKLAISIPQQTALTFSHRGASNASVYDTTSTSMEFATEKELRDYERMVLSRSTELAGALGKSLKFFARYESLSEKTSPAIDMNKCGLHLVHNIVNQDASNNYIQESEKDNGGLAINRYISRQVVLAEGQDAEDLKVLVAAYKPPSAEILVYGRFQHYADADDFSDKAWTLLTTSTTLVSSRADSNDYVEYEFGVPTTEPSDSTAWLNANNNNIIQYKGSGDQIYEGYKVFAIKIVLLSSDSAVPPRLQDMRAIALQV